MRVAVGTDSLAGDVSFRQPLAGPSPCPAPFCSSVFTSLVFPSRFCFSEIPPVCAVVGGILAQEIVKVSSRCGGDGSPPHTHTLWTCPEGALLSLTARPCFTPQPPPSFLFQPIPLGIQLMTSECPSVLSPELGLVLPPLPS